MYESGNYADESGQSALTISHDGADHCQLKSEFNTIQIFILHIWC